MKILFITAYYPPCQYGYGYMRICEQVADGLSSLGHEVVILTSTYRDGSEIKPYPVYRLLKIDPDWHLGRSPATQFFFGRRLRERQAARHLNNVVGDFQPDIIFVWHANSISRTMLRYAEDLPRTKVVYYLANYLPETPDEYVQYWQSRPRSISARFFKWPLAKLALWMLAREGKPVLLDYEHSISVSDYVRQRLVRKGLIGSDAAVIPNAINPGLYAPIIKNWNGGNTKTLKFLIAGRVSPEKGIHTALLAFADLYSKGRIGDSHLTVVGDGREEYKERLVRIVRDHNLQNLVHFKPRVKEEEMPEMLSRHDVLLLPSEWDEPLACIMLEAMASNMVVIGTSTGGTGEVLVHEKTGLVFEPGDPQSLAAQIDRVVHNPKLLNQFAKAGHREVEKNFNIEVTVARIEEYLLRTLGGE